MIDILIKFILLLAKYDVQHQTYFAYYLDQASMEELEKLAELLQEATEAHDRQQQ